MVKHNLNDSRSLKIHINSTYDLHLLYPVLCYEDVND